MASYAMAPSRVTLDIDDTCDVARGHGALLSRARGRDAGVDCGRRARRVKVRAERGREKV
jgi:hypothetical protein